MDDFIGAETVIDRERLRALSQRSNLPAALYLASHFGAIAATTAGLYWTAGTWWCLPLLVLQGLLINFLYAPEHECDHFTAFASRWLNVVVARICGFFILLPNDDHRWAHYAHHRWTQDWEKDTELQGRSAVTSGWQYLWLISGLPLLWGRLVVLVRYSLGRLSPAHLTDAQRAAIERMARLHLAGYIAIAWSAVSLGSWWPVYYWLGPFVAFHWVYRLQGFGEHTFLSHRPHTLLNTRTLKTNAFMRWLNWNMTYHTVHHTYPSVPFYRLPELHREVEAKLGFELPSAPYLELHWGKLKALFAGATELELCAEQDRLISAEQVSRVA